MKDERGEPFFCGKDVARALGYKNPEKALRVHIEDDDKVVNKMDTTYGNIKIKRTPEVGDKV